MTMLEVDMKERNECLQEGGYEALSTYCYYDGKSHTLRIQGLLFDKDQVESSRLSLIQDALYRARLDSKFCSVRVLKGAYLVQVPNREHAQVIVEVLEKKCLGEQRGLKAILKNFMLFVFSIFPWKG